MEFLSKTTQDTKELAESISQKIRPGDVIALYGDLGSGKTTFTKYLVESLGIGARVQSPTFVIVRKYSPSQHEKAEIKTVNHIDLYRLTSKEEVEDIGINELWEEPNSLTIIEWPEVISDLLPKKTIHVKFENVNQNERKIYVQNLH